MPWRAAIWPIFGRRVDEPALRRHVRHGDLLGARADHAVERGEVEPPGLVVVGYVDLDPHARSRPRG
jgi:hypothetical protein